VATETFGIGPGDAVNGFRKTFLRLDKTGQTLDLWRPPTAWIRCRRTYGREHVELGT
jgi:hypothetical protein